MPKAVELPINVMVIVVIAVIILLALVAMYFTGFSPFSKTVGIEGVRGDACRRLVQENGCRVTTNSITISGFDANRNNVISGGSSWDWDDTVMTVAQKCGITATGAGASDDNLASLCKCYYSLSSENACKSLCGCAGGGFSAGGGGGGGGGGGSCDSCASLGKQCGDWPDGCGVILNCGTCSGATPLCDPNGQCTANINCHWVKTCCGGSVTHPFVPNPPSCTLNCHDTFGSPILEEHCGPTGCVGGTCIGGNARCTIPIDYDACS